MIKTNNAEVIYLGVLDERPTDPDPMCLHGAVTVGSGDSEAEAFEHAHDQLHNSLKGKGELEDYREGFFTWTDKCGQVAREQGFGDGSDIQVYIAIRTTNS